MGARAHRPLRGRLLPSLFRGHLVHPASTQTVMRTCCTRHRVDSVALAFLLTAACLLGAGCASRPNPTIVVHQDPKGSVSLEQLPIGSLQAAHPRALPDDTIAHVLEGLRVQAQERLLQILLAGRPRRNTAFTEDEVEFLSPLLARALSQAGPDHVVRYSVVRSTDNGPETTGGALYVKDRSLYVTLTQYRVTKDQSRPPSGLLGPGRDPTGLEGKIVLFDPEGVERPGYKPPTGLVGPYHLRTFVIDYELLDKLIAAGPRLPDSPALPRASPGNTEASSKATNSMTQPPRQEEGAPVSTNDLRDLLDKNTLEIEALKEELRSLQREGDAGK